jgi:hypothetical protein
MPSTSRSEPHEDANPLVGEAPVPRNSFRHRMRSKPGVRQVWRFGVFLLGLLCIAAGGALVVLPGPLTIPPIVLGLWIWSTEFEWAHRLFANAQKKGKEAWEHAKRHPVTSSLVTVSGLVVAGAVIWAVGHYDLVARAKEYVGIG